VSDEKSFDVLHMVIKRESVKIALMRQEDAARTEEDFENLIATWNRLDDNRERRERRYEIIRTEDMLEWECSGEETIIPAPFEHIWWREMLKGSFLDFIHDCPYDIQEFTSSRGVYELVKEIEGKSKRSAVLLGYTLLVTAENSNHARADRPQHSQDICYVNREFAV